MTFPESMQTCLAKSSFTALIEDIDESNFYMYLKKIEQTNVLLE